MTTMAEIRAYAHLSRFYAETVTLTGKRRSGDVTDSITKATRMPMERAQKLFADVGIRGDDTVFNLPSAQVVNSVEPEIGDYITDASSVIYQITLVREVNAKSQWLCVATKNRS